MTASNSNAMCAAMYGHRRGLAEDRPGVISESVGRSPGTTAGALSKMRRDNGGTAVRLVGRLASSERRHDRSHRPTSFALTNVGCSFQSTRTAMKALTPPTRRPSAWCRWPLCPGVPARKRAAATPPWGRNEVLTLSGWNSPWRGWDPPAR